MAHTLVIEHDVYKALQESFGEKSLNEKFNQILPRFNFPQLKIVNTGLFQRRSRLLCG